jgi:hypothetical protein
VLVVLAVPVAGVEAPAEAGMEDHPGLGLGLLDLGLDQELAEEDSEPTKPQKHLLL